MAIFLRLGFDFRCGPMSPLVDPVGQLVPPPHGGPTMRATEWAVNWPCRFLGPSVGPDFRETGLRIGRSAWALLRVDRATRLFIGYRADQLHLARSVG